MVMSALDQMIRKTAWDVDVLVVDLPPGTGDAHLTLCQNTPLAGALIVSTPSKAASSAVRKGINMFHKLNVPVLGVVNNMSYFMCSACSEKHYLFGSNGTERTCAAMNVPLVADIPLTQENLSEHQRQLKEEIFDGLAELIEKHLKQRHDSAATSIPISVSDE